MPRRRAPRRTSWQKWPNRLRIRGRWWDVLLVRGMRDYGLRGATMAPVGKGLPSAPREIHIDAELSPAWRVKVFHHEMLHACFPAAFYKGKPGPMQRLRANVAEEELVLPMGLAVHDVLASPDYARLLAWLRATEVKHRDGWTKGGAA